MSTTEIFLIAMTLIFTIPYLIWRVGKTEYYAPLVVMQSSLASCLAQASWAQFILTITASCSHRRSFRH